MAGLLGGRGPRKSGRAGLASGPGVMGPSPGAPGGYPPRGLAGGIAGPSGGARENPGFAAHPPGPTPRPFSKRGFLLLQIARWEKPYGPWRPRARWFGPVEGLRRAGALAAGRQGGSVGAMVEVGGLPFSTNPKGGEGGEEAKAAPPPARWGGQTPSPSTPLGGRMASGAQGSRLVPRGEPAERGPEGPGPCHGAETSWGPWRKTTDRPPGSPAWGPLTRPRSRAPPRDHRGGRGSPASPTTGGPLSPRPGKRAAILIPWEKSLRGLLASPGKTKPGHRGGLARPPPAQNRARVPARLPRGGEPPWRAVWGRHALGPGLPP